MEANGPVVVRVTLMFCVPPAPEKLKLIGEAMQLVPAGRPLHENDPDPVKPGAEDNNMAAVALPPARTDTWLEVGSALRLKSCTPVPVSWTTWLPFNEESTTTNWLLRAPAAVGLNVTGKKKCGVNTGELGGPPTPRMNGICARLATLKSPLAEAARKMAGAVPWFQGEKLAVALLPTATGPKSYAVTWEKMMPWSRNILTLGAPAGPVNATVCDGSPPPKPTVRVALLGDPVWAVL